MSLPSAPTIPDWPMCGQTTIQFFWNTPSQGSPFEKYTIACSALSYSQDVSANVNDFTVTGLTAGTEYDFTITATNATGTGPAAAFPQVAAGLLPFGPSQASVSTINDTSALVTWTPSTIANQAPTRWYIVTALPSTAGASTLVQTEYFYNTSTFFKGLSTNVSYRFLVQGVGSPGYCIPFAYTSTVQIFPETFLPSMVSGMQLWLDASVASNYALSSSNVTTWFDRSGNGRNGTLKSGAAVIQSNTLNGYPTVNFTAATFAGYSTFSTVTSNVEPSVFMVMKLYNTSATVMRQFLLAGNQGVRMLQTRESGGFGGLQTININWEVAPTTLHPTASYFQTFAQQPVNYMLNTTNGSNLNFGNQGRTSGFTYNSWQFGVNATNAWMDANVAEVLMYHGMMNNIDRQRIEGYLAWKWGLESSLADTHPYKTIRPSPARPQTLITSNRIIHFDASSWNASGNWPNQGTLGASHNAVLMTGARTKNAAGNGIVFDTNNYYLLSTLGLQTQYTLSAWAKLTTSNSFNGGAIFTEKDIDASPIPRAINMEIYTSGANIGGFFWRTNGQASVTTSNITAMSNYWVQYAYTVSTFNTTSTISYAYSNGALIASTLGTFTPTTNQKEYYIGANDEVWQGQPKMLGEIGEISVYSRPLTPLEIRQNYEARYTTYYP